MAFTALQIGCQFFFRELLERPKCQIIYFFSFTNYSGDSHGGTFTTS